MNPNIKRFTFLWLLFTMGMWVLGSEYFNLFLTLFGGFVASLSYTLLFPKAQINLDWYKILLFLPTFCYYSFIGALGVARLAIKTNLQLTPRFYILPLNPKSKHHALIANIYSLMPGTLSIAIESNQLKLHILDESLFDEALIQSLHVRLQAFQNEAK